MKNIHIIPTDKPTGIFKSGDNLVFSIMNKVRTTNEGFHIYITSDEEIKVGDYGLIGNKVGKIILTEDGYEFLFGKGVSYEYGDFYSLQKVCKKIILTTDQDLIKDGVQAIDDEFLEWFVNNTSCEEVEVESGLFFYAEGEDRRYKIIIPREETKQETLEEAAARHFNKEDLVEGVNIQYVLQCAFVQGAKWQAERMYSEEEVLKILLKQQSDYRSAVRNTSPLNWVLMLRNGLNNLKRNKQ